MLLDNSRSGCQAPTPFPCPLPGGRQAETFRVPVLKFPYTVTISQTSLVLMTLSFEEYRSCIL